MATIVAARGRIVEEVVVSQLLHLQENADPLRHFLGHSRTKTMPTIFSRLIRSHTEEGDNNRGYIRLTLIISQPVAQQQSAPGGALRC